MSLDKFFEERREFLDRSDYVEVSVTGGEVNPGNIGRGVVENYKYTYSIKGVPGSFTEGFLIDHGDKEDHPINVSLENAKYYLEKYDFANVWFDKRIVKAKK